MNSWPSVTCLKGVVGLFFKDVLMAARISIGKYSIWSLKLETNWINKKPEGDKLLTSELYG